MSTEPTTGASKWAPKPPPAIAAAAAKANELQADAIAAASADGSSSSEEPRVASQDTSPSPPQQTQEPPSPAPVFTPTGSAPPAQQPSLTPPAPPPAGDFEHRYNSAMGRLQAAEQRERQLQERLNSLEKLLSGVQAAGASQSRPSTPPPTRLITEEEERDYGTEFLAVVGKQAKDELLPEIGSLKATIADLQNRVSAVGVTMAKSGEERLWDELRRAVPNADQQNGDPGFKEWLDEVDVYSGMRRADMLSEAYSRHDAQRVINFFQGYRSENAAVDPPSTKPAPTNGGRPALADYAAPGRATSAPQQAPLNKPIYTTADVSRFFAEKRMGKHKGREAEADAVERDIFLAGTEGRIIR